MEETVPGTQVVTRFAPSPNGSLHLGHAYSAMIAHDLAAKLNGRFLLRIEDIDGPRSRPELAEAFRADLAWLGLPFVETPPQSTRLDSYRAAAERLRGMGVLYPCSCTRKEVLEAATREGPDGPVYPGTCKGKGMEDVMAAPDGAVAWRLDVAKALAQTGPLSWEDERAGQQIAEPERHGDVVLVRKGLPASYHLAATLDDAADGVTLVTRGLDLFHATHIHRLLQALLDLPVPRWHHHDLLFDEDGTKLAKRRGSAALSDLRGAGVDGHEFVKKLRAGSFPAGISLGRP
ncbi:tRNA glutamyl-Q(34) synthetase GluQRS [Altererythrobacter aurantiacus]|uniref:tRNA glutamyl-Q(34) synthetase GluQRS n=1 Tax=Parapontixanthobacter aurantiacus TaxID=1463599 RepID=A0A844ZE95_9SPHN|nr:tRNA glutamyl-Q(34) synthetase GluQRS [Parapontixanthobacter aurantiacus]MXO86205.1 tRNA glutamyl-Q(34) synthetase GluQRS [Parapontixanthobacter aurantiacus]